MKFKRKPIEINVEQFWPSKRPWPKGVVPGEGGFVVYNILHKTYVKIVPGDWIRQDNMNDIYPIADDIIRREYEPVEKDIVDCTNDDIGRYGK